jgi:hypothetical protein
VLPANADRKVRRLGTHAGECGGVVWLHVIYETAGTLRCDVCFQGSYRAGFAVVLDEDVLDDMVKRRRG